MPSVTHIPVIDIDRDPFVVGAEIDGVLTEIGFMQLTGHGVSGELQEEVWDVTREFFDRPLDEKRRVERPARLPYGYFPLATESLAQSIAGVTVGDLKESFNAGPIAPPSHTLRDEVEAELFGPNYWPERPDGFRDAWERYYRTMDHLAAHVMSIFARGLRLPADFFGTYIDRGPSALRAINYPDMRSGAGQLRAGAHTDYGTLTILRQERHRSGLQVQNPDSLAWIDVEPVDDAFVVNIGDLMARWTNDRWRSTMHRVVDGPPGADGSTRRQSMPFFHNANYDAVITCLPTCLDAGAAPRYAPVLAGPHLAEKAAKSITR